MLQPSPAAPSGSALQFLKVISACPRVGSTLVRSLTSTPPALRSTMNSEMSALAPARAGARGDHGEIGDRAVRHRLLDAVERAARRGELDRLRRRIALALEQRQRADRLARGDLRQPFLLLRIAAGDQQALRPRDRRWRRTAPAPARGPFLPRSRRVRDGPRRRRRIFRGSRRRENPSRRGPSTDPCRKAPCRRAPSRTAFGGHFSARNFLASSRICFCSSEKSKFMALYSC